MGLRIWNCRGRNIPVGGPSSMLRRRRGPNALYNHFSLKTEKAPKASEDPSMEDPDFLLPPASLRLEAPLIRF